MLALLIVASLLLELCALGFIGAQLLARGWNPVAVVALAIAWLLGIRLLLVCSSMTASFIARSPRTAEQRLGIGGTARLILSEWAAMLASNFYALPFERFVVRRDASPAKSERIPVVLVHGYLSNRGLMRRVIRVLEQAGVDPLFTHNYGGLFSAIETWADELDAIVREITERTGQPKVILVCHSMGGLAARTYVARHGASRVAKLITIASPHHGTWVAHRGPGRNARQMRRDSALLADLARGEGESGPGFAATSIYSVHDNLVVPQDTSRLPWAKNVAVSGIGHVGILLWEPLHRMLVDELREAGALPAR
jgi:triacylglycerol esterase/lipase EstA (alpha/beta hydrolase family)